MDWGWLFFSFSGRINRAKYWGASLLLFLIMVIPLILAVGTDSNAAWILLIVVFLGVMYSGLAVAAKRLHDRDKSAWWLLLFYIVPGLVQSFGDAAEGAGFIFYLISFGISLWAFIELGCLRGTVGPNRFGPDPLGATVGQAAGPTRLIS
jgi:uncharacterized membrane protein YhaH (DUF805 family)